MADEKEAKHPPEGEAKKKGGLKPILFLVVGAMVGGAGVVFMVPPKEVVKVVGPPQPQWEQVELPDPFVYTINPRVERGYKTALIEFFIVYKQDKLKEAEVSKAIKTNWSRAYSRCMEVLKNTPAPVFNTMDGLQKLRARLREELSASLFPDGLASVDDILWKKVLVQ